MPKRMIAPVVVACTLALASAAAAHGTKVGSLQIQNPWARASIGPARTGAAYLEIINRGESADHLIAVETPVAERAQLHTHIMAGGIAKMRPVPKVEVAPGRSVTLAPGGLHIMLIELAAPLEEGGRVPITLTFANAGRVTVEATVASAGAGQAPQGGAGPGDQRTFDLVIRNRRLVGQDTLRVKRGDKIRLRWTSDEPATLHLHGYDIELALEPGVPGVMSFEAEATGRFPVSSHGFGAEERHGHRALLYLEVHPD